MLIPFFFQSLDNLTLTVIVNIHFLKTGICLQTNRLRGLGDIYDVAPSILISLFTLVEPMMKIGAVRIHNNGRFIDSAALSFE